jgi:NAD(P)H dehydrogenase (quinone)
MIVIVPAAGDLGHLIVDVLLERLPPSALGVRVHDAAEGARWAGRGVHVQPVDYARPETLAFTASDKVLLLGPDLESELERDLERDMEQHAAVIAAAREAGVRLLAYSSLLHADTSTLPRARLHQLTETAIRASELRWVFLRNGASLEHMTCRITGALQGGILYGSAPTGRVAAAAHADYAAAAIAVLTGGGHVGKVYELAGDMASSLQELADQLSRVAGRPIQYEDLPRERFRELLLGSRPSTGCLDSGLSAGSADSLVQLEAALEKGELSDTSGQLRALIKRPTTTLVSALEAALDTWRARQSG